MLMSILKRINFGLVNLPIKSKYYHKQLPTQLGETLKLIRRQNVLNQKCYLIQHVSDLMVKDRRIVLSGEQRKFISEELNKWKNQSGRFQHIATVAWVIKRLNLQKVHQDLYNEIKERFLNDQWYVNFDQSVKALEVFKDLPEGEQKDKILTKIERNIGITMWNVHMKYYARIATGLLEAGRIRSELWQRMENQILQNLGMQYQTRTLCDIFKAYALSQNGNNTFYQMIEKVLIQGHFYKSNFLDFKYFSNQFDDSGDFFSLIIETYAIANKSCGVVLTPDFKDYVYEALMDRKTKYKNLGSLTKTIKSLEGFEFEAEQIKEIEEVILQKKPQQFTLNEIKEFYILMSQRHGSIPGQIHEFIENLLVKDIKNNFVITSELVDLVNFLIANQYIKNEKQFINQVNTHLETNFKYLYPQEARYVTQAIQEAKLLRNNQTLLRLPQLTLKHSEKLH